MDVNTVQGEKTRFSQLRNEQKCTGGSMHAGYKE